MKFKSLFGIKYPHFPHEIDQPILQVNNLNVYYNSFAALKDITFEIQTGQRIAVIGPNGAGKSTLFQAIAGVIKTNSGVIKIYGSEPSGHICIAYVPQRLHIDLNFPASVADVVMMGRIGKIGFFKMPRKKDWLLVKNALETVKMSDMSKRQIGELSGGQQQRVFIARALAQEAEIIMMDEPMTGLDTDSQNTIFSILDILSEKKVTVMVALHDLKMAAEKFETVMLLNKKLISMGPPAKVFNSESLSHAYRGHLHLVSNGKIQLTITDSCCGKGNEADD